MFRTIAILFLLLALTACSSLTTPRSTPAPVEDIGTASTSQPLPPGRGVLLPEPAAGPAAPRPENRRLPAGMPPVETWNNPTLGLAVQNALNEGNAAKAGALIERELGITPRDAFLWLQLSSIRMSENRIDEAEGMAQRALSLSRTAEMQDAANVQLELIRAGR